MVPADGEVQIGTPKIKAAGIIGAAASSLTR
jgi:hypothetical protein